MNSKDTLANTGHRRLARRLNPFDEDLKAARFLLPEPDPQNEEKSGIDIPASLCQHHPMMSETQKPILPYPRSPDYSRTCKKQVPISISEGKFLGATSKSA